MSYRFTATYDSDSVEKVEILVNPHANVDEMVAAFKQFMLACGYHPNNVREIYYGVPDSIPYEEEEETPRTLTEFTDRDIFGEDRTHASDK